MANNSKKYVSLTRLSNFLDNLSNKFAALSHKHTISELTDYTIDTALSPTSNNPVANSALDAEFEAISTAMGALEQAIDEHTHENATESSSGFMTAEMVTKLNSIDDDINNAINSSIATVNEVEIYLGINTEI